MDKQELLDGLSQFSGTTNYYKTSLKNFYYTDGVHYLVDQAGAYWLIDLVLSYQGEGQVKILEFQSWTLRVNDGVGLVILTDGDRNEILRQGIEFTDFPLDKIELWVEKSDHTLVLFLPSEY